MKTVTVFGMALLGLASAQSNQVATMLLPNMDGEPWVASVISQVGSIFLQILLYFSSNIGIKS
jgi:hypothetical protein